MPENRLPDYLPDRFKRIHLELTNRCNFSCLFCPDGRMTRPRGFMDETLARSALDQIAELDLAEKVTFHVMGEPLLHPRFFEILDHAHEQGLKVGLTTNGALLKTGTIQALAERDLHQIDVSLQSPDEASFRATRGTNMDFGRYRERLIDLIAACMVRPNPPVFKIRIMSTRFAGKMKEQLAIPDFLGSSKALQETILDWSRLLYERLGLPKELLEIVARNVPQVGIYGWNVIEISPNIFIETYLLTDWGHAFEDEPLIEAEHGYCFGMRDHFAILYSGDVTLCCIDYDGETSMGNLRDAPLAEILNGPELERIVRGFKRYRLVHPYCKKCLGSTSRLGSWTKPIFSVIGLKILKPIFYRNYTLFE